TCAPSAAAIVAYSRNPSTATIPAIPRVHPGGRNQTVPMRTASRTTAESTRVMNRSWRRERMVGGAGLWSSSPGRRRLLDAAVAALAFLIREYRFEQMLLTKVR